MKVWEMRRASDAAKTVHPHGSGERELECIELGGRVAYSWDDWSWAEGPRMRAWLAHGRRGLRPT